MRGWTIRWTLAVTAGLVLTALLAGWGRPQRAPGPEEHAVAARAVQALTAARPSAPVPADFGTAMGYRPTAGDAAGPGSSSGTAGTAAADGPQRADGGCSSPFGDYRFASACKQHDLGYDLLRYADAKGEPLGGWARRAVDDRFARTTRAACEGDTGCLGMAVVYTAAVRFNSFRQGWGVPVVEPVAAIAAPALAGLLTALLLGAVRFRRGLGRLTAPVRTVAARVLEPRAGRIATTSAALGVGLQPGMLPQPLWVRVVVGGAVVAQTYVVATLLTHAARPVTSRARLGLPRRARHLLLAGSGALLLAAALGAQQGQLGVARVMGAGAGTVWDQLLAISLSLAAGALVLVTLHTLLWRLPRALVRGLRRPAGRRLATLVIAPALVLTGSASAAAAPTGPGGAGVGVHGERFLDAAPDAAALTTATGRPATDPLRVYVGRDQALTPQDRAARAVEQLEAARGFARRVLLVVVPTGSGWVNPEAVASVERLTGGDVATVAVQYAASPSWVAYLRGGEGVQRQVQALMTAIDARVEAMPAADRPRVLLYGESLGAWGGMGAFPRRADLDAVADAALWTGVPAGAPQAETGGPVRTLSHRDDPVPDWSPALLVQPADDRPQLWLPLLSFWRVTGDVIISTSAPAGHGHHYGPELEREFAPLLGQGRAG